MFTESPVTETFQSRLRRILGVMIPILITQLCITGMSLFDTVMSGHAGTRELAGVAIGSNIWMPVFTGLNGILQALTPIVANYRGARQFEKISGAVCSGLTLAAALAFGIIATGSQLLPKILDTMSLEPAVRQVAFRYLGFVAWGILPLFFASILRCFVDSLGYTQVTMRLFLLTMPINACMNYIFIFGKLGMPALGGPGAGVGTAITCWLLFLAFALVVLRLKVFREFHVFRRSGFSFHHVREHLRVGIPMGLAIFLETSFFGVECLLVSRFGTVVVAANQAAMSFCNMLYMVPLSFSLSLTILVGAYVGARDFAQAKAYADTGRISNILIGACFGLFLFLGRGLIATLYTGDASLLAPIMHFLTFAVAFQFFDSTAAPIQGVLRGYKDVKATFYSALAAYWGIALPFGLLLDHVGGKGPDSYWIGLITGIFFSAAFLSLRLRHIEKTRVSGR
ncbi:MATE family efflux transporter [Acidaminococcus timonensis]|uniref:MATE family efflux transporter n=1 Tax=Acidaminococcus timonensis TaxID=1871002 RepID=UPI003077EE46